MPQRPRLLALCLAALLFVPACGADQPATPDGAAETDPSPAPVAETPAPKGPPTVTEMWRLEEGKLSFTAWDVG